MSFTQQFIYSPNGFYVLYKALCCALLKGCIQMGLVIFNCRKDQW